MTWQNAGSDPVTADLRMRLLQTSSSTAVTLGDSAWKQLQVLPGQTVLETAILDFPEVKAETRFLVQWLKRETGTPPETRSSGRESAPSDPPKDQSRLTSAATDQETSRLVGTTTLLVYPTNLLRLLTPVAGEDHPVGVFDPGDVLKPLLKAASVEYDNMEDSGVADFRGKLAIIGPFDSRNQMPGDLAERIEKLARKGTGVVWLQLPPAPRAKIQPSFHTVRIGDGAVIVVQPQLVADLGNSPQAQLNLIRCCQLAREPESPALPSLETPR